MRLWSYDQAMASKASLSEEEYLRTSYSGVDREFRDGDLVERSVPRWRLASGCVPVAT